MAHLTRKRYTKPIPRDAKLVTIDGVPSARFKDKKGKTITAPLTKNGQRIRLHSSKWYGSLTDAAGEPKTVPLFTDKTASQQKLAELVRREERRQTDLADPFEEHRAKTLPEHLEDYRRGLEADGDCVEHVKKTTSRIRAIFDGCGFRLIQDLDAAKVAEFLHGLRRDPPRSVLPVGKEAFTSPELVEALGGARPAKLARVLKREKLRYDGAGKARRYPRETVERLQDLYCRGIGISTSNGYATAIKCFSKWLHKRNRTDRDRLISLSRLNAKTDRRHPRRALGEVELNRLLGMAWNSGETFEEINGQGRAMVYLLAMTTGLRASELASLTPAAFDLAGNQPAVKVRAGYTKNRAQAEQPLPIDVAAAFKAYMNAWPGMAPLWPGKWNEKAAEMLRMDLEAAGIAYRDEQGNVADFHALRHSYLTLLSRLGVNPKVAQELARHSDIRLTMDVYTHARLHDLSSAVEGLPIVPPGGPGTGMVPLAMTGTDGGNKSKSVTSLPSACFHNEETRANIRIHDATEADSIPLGEGSETVALMGFADDLGSMMANEEKLPRLDSNQDKESQNLLCYRYTTGYQSNPTDANFHDGSDCVDRCSVGRRSDGNGIDRRLHPVYRAASPSKQRPQTSQLIQYLMMIAGTVKNIAAKNKSCLLPDDEPPLRRAIGSLRALAGGFGRSQEIAGATEKIEKKFDSRDAPWDLRFWRHP